MLSIILAQEEEIELLKLQLNQQKCNADYWMGQATTARKQRDDLHDELAVRDKTVNALSHRNDYLQNAVNELKRHPFASGPASGSYVTMRVPITELKPEDTVLIRRHRGAPTINTEGNLGYRKPSGTLAAQYHASKAKASE